mmetsp:Transcript_72282/g.211837  ORF Transcript_72282/g.211837 Transcript_72282/m.211837 type:complete len:200 (+) Transcript_72282:187-786(+)
MGGSPSSPGWLSEGSSWDGSKRLTMTYKPFFGRRTRATWRAASRVNFKPLPWTKSMAPLSSTTSKTPSAKLREVMSPTMKLWLVKDSRAESCTIKSLEVSRWVTSWNPLCHSDSETSEVPQPTCSSRCPARTPARSSTPRTPPPSTVLPFQPKYQSCWTQGFSAAGSTRPAAPFRACASGSTRASARSARGLGARRSRP